MSSIFVNTRHSKSFLHMKKIVSLLVVMIISVLEVNNIFAEDILKVKDTGREDENFTFVKNFYYGDSVTYFFKIPKKDNISNEASFYSLEINKKNSIIDIPSKIIFKDQEYQVTSFSSFNSQFNYSVVSEVRIPWSIKQIEQNSFLVKLLTEKYTLDSANEYFTIYNGALLSADQKTLVSFPVRHYYECGFIIPASIEVLYPFVFAYSLSNIFITSGLKSIPYSAFSFYGFYSFLEDSKPMGGNLPFPYLPESIETIEGRAFSFPGTADMYQAFVPKSVKNIHYNAFAYGAGEPYYCNRYGDPKFLTAYKEIIFPQNLEGVYSVLENYEDTKYGRTSPMIGTIIFTGETPPAYSKGFNSTNRADEYTNVYVPRQSVFKYQELVDNGTWGSNNIILPHPDKLCLNPTLGCDGWKEGKMQIRYLLYELGDAKVETIFWRSLNPEVASIDDSGCLTAHSAGKVKVRLGIFDNFGHDYSASALFEVTPQDISSIEQVSDNALHIIKRVYNIQGISIPYSEYESNNLPSGLYIINGKKVLIQK